MVVVSVTLLSVFQSATGKKRAHDHASMFPPGTPSQRHSILRLCRPSSTIPMIGRQKVGTRSLYPRISSFGLLPWNMQPISFQQWPNLGSLSTRIEVHTRHVSMYAVLLLPCCWLPNDQRRTRVHTTMAPRCSHRAPTLDGIPHIRTAIRLAILYLPMSSEQKACTRLPNRSNLNSG